jgi:hypothetical protein
MSDLRFSSFANAGDLNKERAVLRAESDVNIGQFAVFRSLASSTGSGATAGKKIAYWFPDTQLKKGDLVVIYTKRGKSSEKKLDGGRTAHFFYWDSDETYWAEERYGLVVLKVETWRFAKVPDSPSED